MLALVTSPSSSLSARTARLEVACDAAMNRLRVKVDALTGDRDPFAQLGEVLFWLFALTEENSRSDPLLVGLRWARNRIAHGVVVAAPIEPRIYGSEPGLAIPGVSMPGSASRPARWLPRSAIQLGPRDRSNQTEEQGYDAHVAGQPLMDVLDRALAIAR
jgi:hypothetical protein